MHIEENDDLYKFARKVMMDNRCLDSTKYKAILLVAKLGDESDLDIFSMYLDNESRTIRAGIIRGIGILHKKLSGKR